MKYSVYGATMIERAKCFAYAAHGAIGQRRKYTNEAYIVHPERVAGIVQSLSGATWQQVVIAWLHDVVEDTQITSRDIAAMFDGEIAMGVMHLTNIEREAGNRRERHRMNLDRLRDAPGPIQSVKVADIFDNTKNLAKVAPAFAPIFLQEAEDKLAVLGRSDAVLWMMAHDQIQLQKQEIAHVKEA